MKNKVSMLIALGVSLVAGATASAAVIADFQFEDDGQLEGWADRGLGTGNEGLTVSGGTLNATPDGNDPQLANTTINYTLSAGETWDTVVFRVRETQDGVAPDVGGPGILTTYNPIGSLISFNSDAFVVNGNTPGSLVGVDSGAGFFTVTVDISGFAENTLSQMRLDPIGGAFSNSGSQTAGNFYEIDFIQISTIPEPASLMLVGLGGLAMLTRRRA